MERQQNNKSDLSSEIPTSPENLDAKVQLSPDRW